jgi:hypothetical protein
LRNPGGGRKVGSRPGFDAQLAAAPLGQTGKDDAQLAVGERRRGPSGVERPLHADRAREAPERSLGDVKRDVTLFAPGGQLLSGDEQHVAGKDDLDRRLRDPGDVEDRFDRVVGFDDVEGRRAFRRRGTGIEQAEQFGRQLPAFNVHAGHQAILATYQRNIDGLNMSV